METQYIEETKIKLNKIDEIKFWQEVENILG